MANKLDKTDVITICGAGLAGLSCAYALAKSGFDVRVIAPNLGRLGQDNSRSKAQNSQDLRTTAMLAGSVKYLKEIGIWDLIESSAAPLNTIRIIDDTERLFRAPQTDFSAAEIDLEAFGFNVANSVFSDALLDELTEQSNVHLLTGSVANISETGIGFDLTLDSGEVTCTKFLIGADGRNSVVAAFLGGETKKWDYRQSALVLSFEHTLPHHNISTEFHTRNGPFTLVPLSRNRSSLVWVTDPDECSSVMGMDGSLLNELLETRMHSILGKVQVFTKLQAFPLGGSVSNILGEGRAVLIGEAGHVMPPIGAQGFNLGLRDVQTVSQMLLECPQEDWKSIGEQYNQNRQRDVQIRIAAIDLLNRSLLSDFLPVQLVRGLGLLSLGSVTPIRRYLMKQGVG